MKLLPIILLAILCLPGCIKTKSNNELIVGINANNPPFEYIDSGKLVGFDVDIAQALANKLQRKLVTKEFDFDALILALKQGKIDIIISGLSITDKRRKEIAMVPYQGQPITSLAILFWKTAPENIHSFDDLKSISKLPFTIQAGHFSESFVRSINGITINSLPGPPEQLMDIKYGKSIGVFLDPPTAAAMMKQHGDLKAIQIPLSKDQQVYGYGIGIKKDNASLISEVNKAIDNLKSSGTIAKLEAKWGL